MFNVVLFEPEIPPNTGNIIRLCANSGASLHLIRPLGFTLDNKRLRRAGLDYAEWASITEHEDFPHFIATVKPVRILACTTRATRQYSDVAYQKGDALLFGPETRGLPKDILISLPPECLLRIPMLANSRSINLSNAVAIILFEAWRQQCFTDAV